MRRMDKEYKIIENNALLQEASEHIEANEYLTYDTETTGLNARKDKVIGFAFSGKEGVGYYLPIYVWYDDSLGLYDDYSEDKAKRLLKALLDKKLIMHNASFDCRITKTNFNI